MTDPQPRLGSRELFPDLEARAYLNHAAMSPPSVAVRDAMVGFVDDHARKGLGGEPELAPPSHPTTARLYFEQ